MKGSDYAELQAFVAVAAAMSFSRAAERMGVSPSALSQAVRRLETRLGTRLLNRSTRAVALSDAGAALHARLGRLLGELDAAVVAAQASPSELSGRVRVNTSRVAAEAFISPMLAEFCRRHPAVEVDIHLDDSLSDLIKTGCDVGLRLGERLEGDMIAVPLSPHELSAVVASPAYLAECGTPLTPADLHRHRCIVFRWRGSGALYRWELVDSGQDMELAVSGPVIVGDVGLMLQAAVDGIGLAYVLQSQAAPFLRTGQLVQVLQPYCPINPGFYLYRFGRAHLQPQVRAFIDAVAASAQERGAAG